MSLKTKSLRERNNFISNSALILEFIHVPKTAGTSIEAAAATQNISWGLCHFASPDTSEKISLGELRCPLHEHNKRKIKDFQDCPLWHVPSQYFDLPNTFKFNPYKNAKLFVVVRNPFDKIISDYYYTYKVLRKKTPKEKYNDELFMNQYITRKLDFMKGAIKGDFFLKENKTIGNKEYFSASGHFIPQYDYVYEGTKRIIDHVLHFESLDEEFESLMEMYNMNVILPKRKERKKVLSAKNISIENIRRIEYMYAQDFATFGYETISSRLENQFEKYKVLQ